MPDLTRRPPDLESDALPELLGNLLCEMDMEQYVKGMKLAYQLS